MLIDLVDRRGDRPEFDNVCTGRRNESAVRCAAPGRKFRCAARVFLNRLADGVDQLPRGSEKGLARQMPVELVVHIVRVEDVTDTLLQPVMVPLG